jgi:hypothetical protein
MLRIALLAWSLVALSACAMTKQEQVVDITAAYDVAAAAEAAYAAGPSADPTKVAKGAALLAAAQAALLTWSNSSSPDDQTAASAAIAALTAFQASLAATQSHVASASH